jgi:hypothetical protein
MSMIAFIAFPLSTRARTCDLCCADGWGRNRWLHAAKLLSDENIFTDDGAN